MLAELGFEAGDENGHARSEFLVDHAFIWHPVTGEVELGVEGLVVFDVCKKDLGVEVLLQTVNDVVEVGGGVVGAGTEGEPEAEECSEVGRRGGV